MKVAAVLSCWKQKLMSASRGDVLLITIFSMFSGYLPSLYRSRVFPIKIRTIGKHLLIALRPTVHRSVSWEAIAKNVRVFG